MTSTHLSRPPSYVREIDGLRAVAILSVVLYHLNERSLPGGFAGVDVFFVISGYVVSASLARDGHLGFGPLLGNFYARRFLRIIPALLACLLLTCAVSSLLIPKSWLGSSIQDTALYAFLGVSNFALLGGDPYFSPRPPFNPFAQTWSLAVEEQFYVLFPFLFFLWHRIGRQGGMAASFANSLIGALSLASLTYAWHVGATRPEAGFYLLPSRFWELGAGALLFQMQQRGTWTRLPAPFYRLTAWVVGAALMALALAFANRAAFPFPWALPAVAGTVLIVAAVTAETPARGPLARLLGSRPMIFVGKRSYSLYLWHWAVFALFRWTVGLQTPTTMAAAVLLSCGLACLSYSLVEQPVRNGRWILAQRKGFVIVGSLAAILLGWEGARLTFANQARLSLSVVDRELDQWETTLQPLAAQQLGCTLDFVVEPLAGGAVYQLSRRCIAPGVAPRRLFVMGDSHTGAYLPMFSLLAGERDVDVRIYYQAGCGVARLTTRAAPQCASFVAAAIDDLRGKAVAGDVIFLSSLRAIRLSEQWGASAPEQVASLTTGAQAVAERQQGLAEADDIVGRLSALGLRVVIEAPKPVFPSPAFRCSDWFNAGNPDCQGGLTLPREKAEDHRRPVMDSLATLSSAYPGLVVWDSFALLCPGEQCRAVTEAGPLFYDGDHVTNFANKLLYPHFVGVLQVIWTESSGP